MNFVLSAVIDIMPSVENEPELVCGSEVVYLDASRVNHPSAVAEFTVRNTGAAAVDIAYIVASEYFRIGRGANNLADSIGAMTLPAGGSVDLYAQCIPDRLGRFDGQALVVSSARNRFLNIHLSGFGGPSPGTLVSRGEIAGKWSKSGSPYYVCGDVAVAAGARLEIGAGTEVLAFEESSITAGAGAQLLAGGTESDSVYFRALDHSKGWGGIRISDSGYDDVLSYCVITGSHNSGLFIQNASPTIAHSRIAYNQTRHHYGAGIFCERGAPIIRSCVIEHNSTMLGGAFFVIDASPQIFNSLVCRNNASDNASFLYARNSFLTFINLTLADNVDGRYVGGLIYLAEDVYLDFINSILWSDDEDGNLDLHLSERDTVEFHYSDIYTTHLYEDWSIIGFPWDHNVIVWGEGCIATPPRFATEEGREYVLHDDSPCINAGDPNPLYGDIPDSGNPGFAL